MPEGGRRFRFGVRLPGRVDPPFPEVEAADSNERSRSPRRYRRPRDDHRRAVHLFHSRPNTELPPNSTGVVRHSHVETVPVFPPEYVVSSVDGTEAANGNRGCPRKQKGYHRRAGTSGDRERYPYPRGDSSGVKAAAVPSSSSGDDSATASASLVASLEHGRFRYATSVPSPANAVRRVLGRVAFRRAAAALAEHDRSACDCKFLAERRTRRGRLDRVFDRDVSEPCRSERGGFAPYRWIRMRP